MALALDPLGPPAAGLRQGGMSVGLDYISNQMNLSARDTDGDRYKSKSAQVDKTFVNVGYGVADNWEAYVRLGASKFEDSEEIEIMGTHRPAWGLGTKATIYQDGNWKFGGLLQISWNDSKEVWDHGFDEVKWYEYQIAAGPTYKVSDKVSIYGGPYYNYLKGDLRSQHGKWGTIKGEDHVGGYIGGQFAVNDNLALNAEYQLSASDSGMGLSLAWKF